MYSNEDFDNAKTRILKYIIFKKRTEQEIRTKFKNIYDEELLEDVIEYLKQASYINDKDYIERTINNFKILKNLSLKEIKYKLIAKGVKSNDLEEYIERNTDELIEYEINSAKNIINKKNRDLEEQEIKNYLLKKGYKMDNIKKAFQSKL